MASRKPKKKKRLQTAKSAHRSIKWIAINVLWQWHFAPFFWWCDSFEKVRCAPSPPNEYGHRHWRSPFIYAAVLAVIGCGHLWRWEFLSSLLRQSSGSGWPHCRQLITGMDLCLMGSACMSMVEFSHRYRSFIRQWSRARNYRRGWCLIGGRTLQC